MCKERWRTRDLLLEYDSHVMPPRPRTAGLGVIYPWETILQNNLPKQLFAFAAASGYTDNEEEFRNNFGTYLQSKEIIYAEFNNFPEVGDLNTLYFDIVDKILYYWDTEYLPVNTLLINGTILDAGTAADTE